jgi:putative addiction module component (TIGR02574 family)
MGVIELEAAFEKLSPRDKEQFAEWYEERLAQGGFEPDNEAVWAAEADRRLEEIRSGKVQAVPGEQVMAEFRRRYGV